MKKHYDIGIVGCWYWGNYGSLLNGYATHQILKSFGLSALNIITPYNGFEAHAKKFFEVAYTPEEISTLLPFERVHEFNDVCDMFLTGSDQIWHVKDKENTRFAEYFRLNFVDDAKRKISFATSFGKYLPESDETHKVFTNLFKRYNAISVREQEAVDICRDIYGINAVQVMEPVLDVSRDCWDKLAEYSEYHEKEPYLLTYILDPTPEKRTAIEFYGNKLGVKVVNILDGFSHVYDRNKAILNLPNTLPNIWCADFLKYFQNAEFVITDSFHGVCFSLVFNKPFIAIGNYGRGIKRFESLLDKVGMTDRLVPDPKAIPEDVRYLEKVDFNEVNRILRIERERSVEWLKNAIEKPINELPPIEINNPKTSVSSMLDKSMCTGCGACVSICPKNALTLKKDDIGYYRSFIDVTKCVDCGLCSQICPALKLPKNDNTKNPTCFEFVAADEQIVYSSSSGGAFPVLAGEAFRRNGVVCGAAWKSDFSVEHIIVDKKEELSKLQKSKYLQSYLGNVFRGIKEKLENNIFVLFTGCPCQVAGLKAYLGRDYDNLLMVDLLCGNSPSTLFFQKYIQEEFPEGLDEYAFRYKAKGYNWDFSIINAKLTDGTSIIRHGGSEDNYQRVYHNHTMCALHCEKCVYQSAQRFGDLTIGDFWGIKKRDQEIDIEKGVSCIIVNNEKGRSYLESLPEDEISVKKKAPLSWLGGNGMTQNGHNYCSPQRDDFYKAIKNMPFSQAVNYALKPDHGKRKVVLNEEKLNPLQYAARTLHFTYDENVWEEHFIFGATVLTVRPSEAKVGRYAILPLGNLLSKKKRYIFNIRFKIKSNTQVLNFHIKDSGSRCFQVIYSYRLHENNGEEWIELSHEFIPKSDIFDEFMIGASQVSGEGNFLAIDYINIIEK